MNARLDLLALPSTSAVTPSAFACCPRYMAGVDAPPPLAAGLADLAERIAVQVAKVLWRMAQGATVSRL